MSFKIWSLGNILVTTPNKLIYTLESIGDVRRKKLLKKLRWLIVDESDRLFDTIEGDKSFYVQVGGMMLNI